MAVILPTGCVTGSLASSTGPRSPGQSWSVAGRQMAHAGEEVLFDFVLQDWRRRLVDPNGLADYCAVIVGDERIEAEPDVRGHFCFKHRFSNLQPGQKIKATAVAFRQRGGRDHMRIRGNWMHSDSPYEQPDRKVATDSIVFAVYEAPIELKIVRPPDDLDPETGVLRIYRHDGSTTSVFINRPLRPGFTITGPAPDGYYRVRYTPSGSELNPIGTTEVSFRIHDVAGRKYEVEAAIKTP